MLYLLDCEGKAYFQNKAMVMPASSSFKLAFLKQMLRGFRHASIYSSCKSLTLDDRKDAIKLSADVAMAAARGDGARWPRGLIANLAMDEQRRPLLKSILGGADDQQLPISSSRKSGRSIDIQNRAWKKIPRSKSIIRRSFRVRSARRKMKMIRSGRVLASSLVRKRTHVLRKLIPGGESMDGFSLLDETLDYVISLRAQVDLMRSLLEASSETSDLISDGRCTMQVRKASETAKL